MKINTKQLERNLFLSIFLIALCCLFISLLGYSTFPKLFNVLIWFNIFVILIWLIIMSIFIFKHGGIKQTIKWFQIKTTIEDNLVSISAYRKWRDDKVITPPVAIDQDKQEIIINVNDMNIRSKIESNQEILSSGLPDGLIVYKTYLSKDQNELIIKYKDISKDKRIEFDNSIDFINWVINNNQTIIKLDNDNDVDLTENNGLLITGKSGSGKSFFAQQVLIQGILKHWNISILDYKRSYQAFKDYCKVAFTIEEITNELENILKDLHERQQAMDEVLKENPQALAIDNGYPVKFVLIEEYLALVNSGADKKTLDKIEKMILEITTTGRSLNVYLCMVLQVSSASALNTSIRANLPIKIVFGNPDRTIYETTFGKGSVPDVMTKMEKGEGLCSIDGDIIPFSSPFVKCGISPILKDLS